MLTGLPGRHLIIVWSVDARVEKSKHQKQPELHTKANDHRILQRSAALHASPGFTFTCIREGRNGHLEPFASQKCPTAPPEAVKQQISFQTALPKADQPALLPRRRFSRALHRFSAFVLACWELFRTPSNTQEGHTGASFLFFNQWQMVFHTNPDVGAFHRPKDEGLSPGVGWEPLAAAWTNHDPTTE